MVRSLSVENDALRKVNVSSFYFILEKRTRKHPAGNMFGPWTCTCVGFVSWLILLGCFLFVCVCVKSRR